MKINAPIDAEKLDTVKQNTFPCFFFSDSIRYSRLLTHKSPAMAPKESCKLIDAAAKGLTSKIQKSADVSAVGPSLSRPNKGAVR